MCSCKKAQKTFFTIIINSLLVPKWQPSLMSSYNKNTLFLSTSLHHLILLEIWTMHFYEQFTDCFVLSNAYINQERISYRNERCLWGRRKDFLTHVLFYMYWVFSHCQKWQKVISIGIFNICFNIYWCSKLKEHPVLYFYSFVHNSSINERKNSKLRENNCYKRIKQ